MTAQPHIYPIRVAVPDFGHVECDSVSDAVAIIDRYRAGSVPLAPSEVPRAVAPPSPGPAELASFAELRTARRVKMLSMFADGRSVADVAREAGEKASVVRNLLREAGSVCGKLLDGGEMAAPPYVPRGAGLRRAVDFQWAYHNFCRVDRKLRVTPAMDAGVTDRVWFIKDIVALIESREVAK